MWLVMPCGMLLEMADGEVMLDMELLTTRLVVLPCQREVALSVGGYDDVAPDGSWWGSWWGRTYTA